ncbi:MAG: hypothetical protein KAX11_10095, partial [Candidatus Aminicenantes bacterium]|nr:hypothetical protein [Candidatus Aminicenantes bacterium]
YRLREKRERVKASQTSFPRKRETRIKKEAKGSLAQSHLIYVIPVQTGIQIFEFVVFFGLL